MDPWCFDIPIALKPTFINMSVDFECIDIFELIHEDAWDLNSLYDLSGNNFDIASSLCSSTDNSSFNHWVWQPITSSTNISIAVYHHLNHWVA